MPEYTFTYDSERGNHTNEDGETLDEFLDDGDEVQSVLYNGSTEVVEIEHGAAEEHECDECGRTFDSKRGLASHSGQAH